MITVHMIYSTIHLCACKEAYHMQYSSQTAGVRWWNPAACSRYTMLDCVGSTANKDKRLSTLKCFGKAWRPRKVHVWNAIIVGNRKKMGIACCVMERLRKMGSGYTTSWGYDLHPFSWFLATAFLFHDFTMKNIIKKINSNFWTMFLLLWII